MLSRVTLVSFMMPLLCTTPIKKCCSLLKKMSLMMTRVSNNNNKRKESHTSSYLQLAKPNEVPGNLFLRQFAELKNEDKRKKKTTLISKSS